MAVHVTPSSAVRCTHRSGLTADSHLCAVCECQRAVQELVLCLGAPALPRLLVLVAQTLLAVCLRVGKLVVVQNFAALGAPSVFQQAWTP